MCPACLASAVTVIGNEVTTGGVTAVLARMVRSTKREKTVHENKRKDNRS